MTMTSASSTISTSNFTPLASIETAKKGIIPFPAQESNNIVSDNTITIDVDTLSDIINNAVAKQLQKIEEDKINEKKLIKAEKQRKKEARLADHHRAYNGTTDPIKDPADIEAAKEYFLSQPNYYTSFPTNLRNYALFIFGCNTARRISDILRLTIGDVMQPDKTIKSKIKIIEKKTDKPATVFINDVTKNALLKYINEIPGYPLDSMLFPSRKNGNENKAMSERSVWRIMKEMSIAIGLDKKGINVGTHTMRKTFAYKALKEGNSDGITTATLQKILNHSSEAATQHYSGIGEEELENIYMSIQI